MDKSLVKGRAEVTKAVDAPALSERLRESATKRECDVLCRVVVIDPRVALCLYGHIQQAVRTDLLQRTQVEFSFGGLLGPHARALALACLMRTELPAR